MKKIISYILFILVLFLLQTCLFSHFALGGIQPNLLLIFTASAAIINGSLDGCTVGFCCGLLIDLTFGTQPGLMALGLCICGYLAGMTNRFFYKEDITFPILVIAGADLLLGLYIYIVSFLTRGRQHILFYLHRIILPEVVYTVIIAVFLYRIILFILVRMQKKGSER